MLFEADQWSENVHYHQCRVIYRIFVANLQRHIRAGLGAGSGNYQSAESWPMIDDRPMTIDLYNLAFTDQTALYFTEQTAPYLTEQTSLYLIGAAAPTIV